MTTSSTVMRAFAGMLELGEDHVPATIRFSDGYVALLVAQDEVGRWPADEVDIVPADRGYAIRAEGDSVRFLPDEPDRFGTFVDGPETEPAVEPDPDVSPPPALPTPAPVPVSEPDPEVSDLFGPPTEEDLADFLVEELEEDEETEPETQLFVEEPDEYFAAGLAGPSTAQPRPTFGATPAATAPGQTGAENLDDASPEPQVVPAVSDRLAGPDTSPVEPDPGEQPPVDEPTDREPDPVPVDPAGSGPHTQPADPEPMTTARPDPEEGQVEAASISNASEENGPSPRTISGLLTRLRRQEVSSPGSGPEPYPDGEADDDLPTPISDSDNLKQWALVVAGGVVLLVILGIVVWGLMSLMGGDDGDTPAPEAPATTVPVLTPTVPATAPTTLAPSTTVPAENRAAATAFVTSWNEIARDYAYHLTIDADNLPISTAPAPTVHLTYGEEGVLELTMAPKGTGADRDILVAMGVAVAWADPGLSPEGRKQLLGAMGIDVDAPKVSDMGGSLERNGVSYSTEVVDGVIRFRVTPAA